MKFVWNQILQGKSNQSHDVKIMEKSFKIEFKKKIKLKEREEKNKILNQIFLVLMATKYCIHSFHIRYTQTYIISNIFSDIE